MEATRTDRFKIAILLVAATGVIAGLAFCLAGQPDIANRFWIAGAVPALAALLVDRSIGRGEVGLKAFAEGRAGREMHDLLSRAPRTATRHRNGEWEDVSLDGLAAGDRLLTPVQGALLQEAIGVAVILNALRSLRIVLREYKTPGAAAQAAHGDALQGSLS